MTTPTLESKLQVLHTDDGIVDLFKLDCTAIGGTVYFFTPQCYANGSLLSWGGQPYSRIPIGIDGFEQKSTATDLPQPTLSISDVGGVILAPVVALGDLTGATVYYYRVHTSYLDGQENPDTTKFMGPGVWTIYQKTLHASGQMVQFQLASPLDLPGMMFPVRQVLIYPDINPPDGIYFPGVSPYRLDMYQSA
jgi:lambda family phage minor tail protein L